MHADTCACTCMYEGAHGSEATGRDARVGASVHELTGSRKRRRRRGQPRTPCAIGSGWLRPPSPPASPSPAWPWTRTSAAWAAPRSAWSRTCVWQQAGLLLHGERHAKTPCASAFFVFPSHARCRFGGYSVHTPPSGGLCQMDARVADVFEIRSNVRRTYMYM